MFKPKQVSNIGKFYFQFEWKLNILTFFLAVELQRRGYYDDVKELIETMYRENGNKKVTVVAHSMGAAIMLHFLTQSGVVTQEWKDQFIGNFITLSAAWAGGNEDVQAAISGLGLINERPDDIFGLFRFLKNYIRKAMCNKICPSVE